LTWASVMAPILTRVSPILLAAGFFFICGNAIFLYLRGKSKLFGYSGPMYWSKSTSGRARLWQELGALEAGGECRGCPGGARAGHAGGRPGGRGGGPPPLDPGPGNPRGPGPGSRKRTCREGASSFEG